MTLEELRHALSIIDETVEPITAILHLKQRNGDLCKADITTELQAELKEVFYHSIKSKYFNDAEFRFEKISTALETLNTAFLFDIDALPDDLKFLTDFDPNKIYKSFSISSDEIELTKALLITIGTSTNYFTIYKHVHSITIIRQNRLLEVKASNSRKRLISIIPAGDRLGMLTEDVLNITSSIDFLYINNNLIVDNLNTLTQKYGYHDIVKKQATERINTVIKSLDLIENLEELTAFINNPRYAKKIMKIQPDSPVMKLDITKIKTFLSEHKKLRNKFTFDDTTGKIILDTIVSKERILNILNDAYLKSDLTGLDYESEAKAEMKEED
jgi:hypothetical protein